MRKISGQLLSSKPVSLSRAAKLVSRFAAVDNGSSAAISLYLQRTADAFNHLVQFHNKRPKNSNVKIGPELEKNTIIGTSKDSRNEWKNDKKTAKEAAEINPNVDEVHDLKSEEKEQEEEKKKRKKKRKRDGDYSKEKSTKRSTIEGFDS